jgi:Guanylate-binding protein, N-terminal domain
MENPLTDRNDWMGEDNEPLVGFSWKGGITRHTSGAVMWSDVFLHDTKTEKLAIVLMDTQGLFDGKTTAAESSKIFALGTLLSSTQIFNLNGVIQEDQLQYLQAATDFAKFAVNDYIDKRDYNKPFQNIFFLMRDWSHQHSFGYGLAGGAQYIADTLHVKDDQHPDLQPVRKYIKNTFDSVNCFLLPHPGYKIVTNNQYNGNWGELNEDFKDNLEDLVQAIFAPKHLKKKRFMGKEVTVKEFKGYMTAFFGIFQSPKLKDMKTIYETAIEKQMETIIAKCLESYKKAMKEFEDFSQSDFAEVLDRNHNLTKTLTILSFRSERKMGSNEHDMLYEAELEREIDLYHTITKQNLLNIHENVLKIQKQNEAAIESSLFEATSKLEQHQKMIDERKMMLERENAEKVRKVHANIHQREEEKEAEIARLRSEYDRQQMTAKDDHERMIAELKDKIQRDAEEKNRQLNDEIKRIQSQQAQGSVDSRIQNDIDKHLLLMQQAAEQRREDNRIEQERRDMIDKRFEFKIFLEFQFKSFFI